MSGRGKPRYRRGSGGYSSVDWKTYRYGRDVKVVHKPIFDGERRKHVILQVMDVLRDWRFSAFEHEASCRNGLRSALVSAGHGWLRADTEAAAIVAEGLYLLGAKRPTYDEGQWAYTVGRESCVWCRGAIDEADQARGYRFCSPHCARVANESMDSASICRNHAVARNAYRVIRDSDAPAKECAHCRRMFKSYDANTPRAISKGHGRYCSKACHDASMVVHQPRSCEICEKEFRPLRADQTLCSIECRAVSNTKHLNRCCKTCGTSFRYYRSRSKPDDGKYCSVACARKGRAFIAIEKVCDWCATPYIAKSPKGAYCTPACMAKASKLRTGKWKPVVISAPVFDFTLREMGLKFTCDRVAA